MGDFWAYGKSKATSAEADEHDTPAVTTLSTEGRAAVDEARALLAQYAARFPGQPA